jgi:hypothetical protein
MKQSPCTHVYALCALDFMPQIFIFYFFEKDIQFFEKGHAHCPRSSHASSPDSDVLHAVPVGAVAIGELLPELQVL